MQEVYFPVLFPEYIPPEGLEEALAQLLVTAAEVDQAARSIRLTGTSGVYIAQRRLREVEDALRHRYGLRECAIAVRYPESLLPQMEFRDLAQVLIRAYSPAAAILAGAKWELDGDELHVHLAANGKAALAPHLPKGEAFLQELFGVRKTLVLHSATELEGKALFAETERIRQEAIKNSPAVAVAAAAVQKMKAASGPSDSSSSNADLIFGRPFGGEVVKISDLNLDMFRVVVQGKVFAVNHRELKKRGAWVVSFDVTDYTGSVRINQFMEADKAKPILDGVQAGMWVKIQGKMTFDRYDNEMVMQPNSILKVSAPKRVDTAPDKRVELHLHTTMSAMDALTKTGEAVKRAASWGHRAIAITDHGGAQSFPDAMKAASKAKVAGTDENIKILYGCEGYYVNDVDDRIAVHGDRDFDFDHEFVAFDLETTGLSSQHDTIIEIGAAIMRRGEVIDTFQMFVDPKRKLQPKIIELTGITDAMLTGAPDISEALPQFLEFVGDRPLCAHNADFDTGFVAAACERLGLTFQPTFVDTLILAQNLLPDLGKYKLNIVADALSLPDFNHHRASDDAITCGYLLARFYKMLEEQDVHSYAAINPKMETLRAGGRIFDRRARHIILFAKNSIGLRNLYRLISYGNLKYFKRVPIMPKSELLRWREGLIIGSACEAGELFQAVIAHKSWAELKRIASFYDFLEIQPICNNRFMLEKGMAEDEEELRGFNRTIVQLGEELGKPVCATGDVHFLDPEDEIYRHILLATKQMQDADKSLPIYFKTTDEMLQEFSYLGEEKAYEVVVKNPNFIADCCETLRPVPHNLFAPKIENSVEDLNDLVYGKFRRLYGDNPPEVMRKRVETEMHDIISCHYDVIYMSAQKLVQNSLEHGYLVGSRGSVGSSIVAFMSGITEVNSFAPHYRCPQCKYTTFEVPEDCACGADLPDAVCPECGAQLEKDGFNIPFETFLGFGGDKVPDIDLNFSGEYQAKAHAYCVEMFGKTHVFRAGTIGTVAEKTAYGYVKKYLAEREKTVSKAEENRLAAGCVDVKRTTGQHPGGLVVIPQENEIWDFCPVQHPADDKDSEWITTHFEYHSMEENLLKLDMLGHDDPTMIRMLEDMTGVDAQKIPLDDKDTMSIFISSKILGFEDDPILGPVGTCAIPEFGTSFTRGMLLETQPTKFDTLIRLSGFSHGTDVWLGNARDLILSKTASVNDAIGCRDDIMLYLIKCGMPEKRSFKIMEAVRKGRGLPDGAEEEMKAAGVPDWYIGSCKKIKYLFPKAHATAYVMMAFRIAWFKVHEPLAFYATFFSIRAKAFDAAECCKDADALRRRIREIENNKDATAVEQDLMTTLEVCYEFCLRGFHFEPIDIYRSDATKFLVTENGLLPPFTSVRGLGETAALDTVEKRKGKTFTSVEEFSMCCNKLSQTHIDQLRALGAFAGLPETSQLTLF